MTMKMFYSKKVLFNYKERLFSIYLNGVGALIYTQGEYQGYVSGGEDAAKMFIQINH
jgi:hypothetical protein